MTANKTEITGQISGNRWYLNIMSPNTKGEKFAWLDPTSIYINGDAFHDLLDAALGVTSYLPPFWFYLIFGKAIDGS